jgi:hypothetical protein
MICFRSCYGIDLCIGNSHVLKSMIGEQHDMSVAVYIRGCAPFQKVAKEADNNEKNGRDA